MEFNPVIRGANRQQNDEEHVNAILDAGFICHVAITHQGQSMIIPTAYGRKGNCLYIHGSSKNFMMQEMLNGQTVCVSVTHLDGVVLGKNLFFSSVNYRSVVLFGKAEQVKSFEEKEEALSIICNHIVDQRSNEVPIGSDAQIDKTFVIKFTLERASAKIRTGGPMNDDDVEGNAWSGHIPLTLVAGNPVIDPKRIDNPELTDSVKFFLNNHNAPKH